MHKHSWQITVFVEGDIVLAVTLAKPTYDSFKKIFAPFKGNYVRIAYEAGPAGFNLYDRLTEDGFEYILSPLLPLSPSRAEAGSRQAKRTASNWPSCLRAICSKSCDPLSRREVTPAIAKDKTSNYQPSFRRHAPDQESSVVSLH